MISQLYERFPSLLIARRNLQRTEVRSALAMLGIVIGVVAIASLGIFGTALQDSYTSNLGDIGNQLFVSPAHEEGVEALTTQDVQRIERSTDATVVPLHRSQGMATYGADETVVTIYGVSNPQRAFTLQEGRIPSQLRNGALVGESVAYRLGVGVGNTVDVEGETYRVLGILESQGTFSPISPGESVVVPPNQSEGSSEYSRVLIAAESGQQANESAMAVRDSLNRRDKRVDVLELSSIVDQISSFLDILNLVLVGIGAISLVVAGVSILNVMLMNTIERREEIGVLRAVGYQKRDVLKILLAESAILGVVGSLIGIALSVAAGMLINWVTVGDPMAIVQLRNLLYIAAAFGFGLLCSVASGLYPAWKAANENPVTALQS